MGEQTRAPSWEASREPAPCRSQEGSLVLVALGDCGQVDLAGGSVWRAGVVGNPEQIRYNASVQLQDGAHTEQVHNLV